MARFRKKPVEIEAVQLTDALLDAEHPCADHWPGILYDPRPGERCARIHTLEGTMRADLGDWIIRGVKGEVYPCKPDIFAATYEPAESREAIRPASDMAAAIANAHREGWQAAIEALADAFKNLPAVSAAIRQIPYQPPEDRGDG